MVLTFQHATFSIFALLWVGAYLPCFNVLGPFEKMPVDSGKPTGDKRWASVRPPFLGTSPCGEGCAVPKEGCLVVQGAAGWCCRLRSTSDDQYPEPSVCRIGTAASNGIFHLSHCYKAWKCWWRRARRLVLSVSVCAMKFLGGVQCVQYWPHPLHSWFIFHSQTTSDGDSEVLGT